MKYISEISELSFIVFLPDREREREKGNDNFDNNNKSTWFFEIIIFSPLFAQIILFCVTTIFTMIR